jgi:1,2-phenylacetyl-CoA epoxidase PaaB subunit
MSKPKFKVHGKKTTSKGVSSAISEHVYADSESMAIELARSAFLKRYPGYTISITKVDRL